MTPRRALAPRSANVVERYSPFQARFFALYFERYFRRHMNALRLTGAARVRNGGAGPLILYANHPGWWDAALYLILARRLFPDRRPFAPMDREMLEKYAFFGRIGAYGVDLEKMSGAADFFRQSALILSRDDSLLWIAAQGRFSDPRERPLGLKPGLAWLCEAAPGAVLAPVAFEYAFWTERSAEAFAAFGEPVPAAELLALDREARQEDLSRRLAETMDQLARDVVSRDPERFETVLTGRAGVGGVYDAWKSVAAVARGGRWDPAHRKGARPGFEGDH